MPAAEEICTAMQRTAAADAGTKYQKVLSDTETKTLKKAREMREAADGLASAAKRWHDAEERILSILGAD